MTKRKVFRIITWGALGDGLVITPVFKALKQKHPGCKIMVFYSNPGHGEILRGNPYIDSLNTTSFWRSPVQFALYHLRPGKFHYTNVNFVSVDFAYRKHVKEIAAEIFDVELEDKKLQLFLTPAEEAAARDRMAQYPNPITMHITSRCSQNHMWVRERWEQLVREMPGFTFVQLGHADEEKVEGAVDLRGKTSFREAVALIKHSVSFVGIDSVFAHATNAVDTHGVVLFGDSLPDTYGHENNVNLYKAVPCAPCMHILWGYKCPYNNECMRNITVRDVRQALWQVLEKKGFRPEENRQPARAAEAAPA